MHSCADPPQIAESVDIGVLIEDLRDQLVAMDERRRAGKLAPTLELSEAQVEVSFVVKAKEEIGAGFELEVVTADVASSVEREAVQKLTVTLVPASPRLGVSPPAEE